MPPLKKRFGQHFLHDQTVLARIARVCLAVPGERTVEVGPGAGALTAYLLDSVESLDIVEIDRDLISGLRRRFADSPVTVHEADALHFPFCAQIPGRLRVVGNLPYNISSPLIFYFLAQPCIEAMVFLLQQEVVERLAAPPGGHEYGRLSVMVQAQCEVSPLFAVPATAFTPPPKVESRLVSLRPVPPRIPAEEWPLFAEIVATAFSQRRKMLRHNLKPYFGEKDWEALGLDSTRRAETLSLQEFAALAAYAAARRARP